MDKALNYLALARKGGMAELGEEPVGAAARAGKACLILVAGDASDHTWRRAMSFAAGTDQQVLRLAASKDAVGAAIGRTSLAIAAVTDPALALALVKALGQEERHGRILEMLQEKTDRKRQREKEAKAHTANVRKGKIRKKETPSEGLRRKKPAETPPREEPQRGQPSQGRAPRIGGTGGISRQGQAPRAGKKGYPDSRGTGGKSRQGQIPRAGAPKKGYPDSRGTGKASSAKPR